MQTLFCRSCLGVQVLNVVFYYSFLDTVCLMMHSHEINFKVFCSGGTLAFFCIILYVKCLHSPCLDILFIKLFHVLPHTLATLSSCRVQELSQYLLK